MGWACSGALGIWARVWRVWTIWSLVRGDQSPAEAAPRRGAGRQRDLLRVVLDALEAGDLRLSLAAMAVFGWAFHAVRRLSRDEIRAGHQALRSVR